MKSGKLDRRIGIEVVSYSTAGDGSQVETWSELTTCFAERESRGATERFAASQTFADIDTLWRIRWNQGLVDVLNPKSHRITYGGRTFNILGVVEIGRKEGLHIPCAARGDDGAQP